MNASKITLGVQTIMENASDSERKGPESNVSGIGQWWIQIQVGESRPLLFPPDLWNIGPPSQDDGRGH
jgi:hypothetical protein